METLPVELIQSILVYLSPEDLAAVAQTCQQLHRIARDDRLWRTHLLSRYSYYARVPPYSNVDDFLFESVHHYTHPSADDSTWRVAFVERATQDKQIRSILNDIVSFRKNSKLPDITGT